MNTPDIRAGFMPLYLKLYEDAHPGSYHQFTPFIKAVRNRIEKCGITAVSPGVVFDTPHIEAAAGMFATEDISFVVLLHLSYSPSLLAADFLEKLELPVLLIDTTPEYSFDGMGPDYLMRNHGIHGVMDLTSVLTSRGVEFTVVSGHLEDTDFIHRLERTLSAFRASVLFKNQKVGITGAPFAGMGDFAVDFSDLESRFGTTVCEIPVEDITSVSDRITETGIEERIEKDRSFFDLSKVSPDAHSRAVRDYLAIRTIIDEQDINAYTMNFQHIGGAMPTPFYACSGLISEGIGYGGEGDVLTATLGRPLNIMSAAAKFDEFFCADWKNNRILMSHMGESDIRFIKKKSSPYLVERDALLNPFKSVIYRFQAEPGEATFVNISPCGNGDYRLVCGLLDIVDEPILDEIVPPHYQVSPRMPVGEFLECYAAEGGGHHVYVAKSNIMRELSMFCGLAGLLYRPVSCC